MKTMKLWILIFAIVLQWRDSKGGTALDDKIKDWELVFRGVAGSNSMMNRFWRNDLNPSSCTPNYGCFPGKIEMSSTTPTMRHLKSLLVDKWICLMTEWVKIEVLSGSKRVAHFIFNGTASSKTNWFDDDRLMESSYADLEEDTCYTYSYLSDHYHKSFQIATKKDVNAYCVSKRGWLQVIDYQPTHSYTTNCDWMKAAFPGVTKYPLILYAIGSKSTVWRDQKFGRADAIHVSISRKNKDFTS